MFNKIYVEITNICNLNCSFCSKDHRSKKEMSIEEFELVIKKIKDHTKSIYLHIKGEPLMHSKLDEILNICDKYNMVVRITTNGTLLDKKIDILCKHKIKQLNVSLHCENNYEDYFKKVFDSCSKLNCAVVYRIWLLNNYELDSKSKLIISELENYYKVDLSDIINKNNIKIIDNVYLDKANEFIWPNESDEKNNGIGYCLGTRTHIGILSDGTVVPCCLDSDGLIKLGNIFNEDLEDIINGKCFKEINEGFTNNRIVNDICKKCNYRKIFDK